MNAAGEVGETSPHAWGDRVITSDEAEAFARTVTLSPRDRGTIAHNLAAISPTQTVRGVFFEGLARVVGEAKGPGAMTELLLRAGVPGKTVAFRSYPHRDFYKLYYLSARLLYPQSTFNTGLREVARTFFPIFKSSLLGKTMSALMGENPRTILPLLAKAYNISVEGNEHEVQMSPAKNDHELIWRCKVEPVEWYPETFGGIIEGTMATHRTAVCAVKMIERQAIVVDGQNRSRYAFKITW